MLGVVLAMAILTVTSVVACRLLARARAEQQWVTHTHSVIETAQDLLAQSQSVRAIVRTFVVTGDDLALAELQATRAVVDGRVSELQALTADAPDQQSRLASLRQLLADRLRWSDAVIETRRRDGLDAARRAVVDREVVAGQIARTVAALIGAERRRLTTRESAASVSAENGRLAVATGAVSGVTLLGLTSAAALSGMRRRRAATTSLASAERLLAGVLETVLDGVLVFDPVREPADPATAGTAPGKLLDLRYKLVNPAAMKMLGRTELVGRRMLQEFPSSADYLSIYAGVIDTGQPYEGEIHYEQDGLDSWFRIAAVRLGDGLAIMLSDVTARRQTEETLRETSSRLEALVGASPLPIFTYDTDLVMRSWNPAAERVFGWTEAEVVGRPYPLVRDDGERAEFRARTARLFFGERITGEVARRYRRDGTPVHVSISAALLVGDDEKIRGVMGVVEDVTDRRRAQAELASATARLSAVVSNAPLAIFTYSLQGLVTSWNPAAERMFGWTAAEVIGRGLPIIPEELSEDWMHHVVAPVGRGTGFTGMQTRRRRRDGTEIRVTLSAAPLRSAILDEPLQAPSLVSAAAAAAVEGSPLQPVVGVLVMLSDDTDRNVADQTIRDQQAFLRHVLDLNPSLIYAKDLDGRFVLANQSIAEFYDSTPERMLGKTDSDFHEHDAECEEFLLTDRLVIAERRLVEKEEFVTDRMGRSRVFHTMKQPLLERDGSCRRLLGVSTDVTELKNAESALLLLNADLAGAKESAVAARETADAANAAKSRFLANVSHEIRTPMTAVMGFADRLLEPGLSPDDRLDFVQTIRRNGAHLLEVLGDVLDLSKIEAGRMDVERIECSPQQVVEEVASLMRLRAAEARLRFDVVYAGPRPRNGSHRPDAAAAGADQPREQRRQVHEDRRRADRSVASRPGLAPDRRRLARYSRRR